MCRVRKQDEDDDGEKVIDQFYSEQQEHFVHTSLIEQQMELEQLIQLAENLKNDIIQLHDQEQQLIQRLKSIKASRTSLFSNLYSFISNKNVLFFVSGFLTGVCIVPAISRILSTTTRV